MISVVLKPSGILHIKIWSFENVQHTFSIDISKIFLKNMLKVSVDRKEMQSSE